MVTLKAAVLNLMKKTRSWYFCCWDERQNVSKLRLVERKNSLSKRWTEI